MADPSAAMVVAERVVVVVVAGEVIGERVARAAANQRAPRGGGVPHRLDAAAVHADRPETAIAGAPTERAGASAGAAAKAGVATAAAGGAAASMGWRAGAAAAWRRRPSSWTRLSVSGTRC